MTRTKKWMLATLAGMLVTGVAVGSEIYPDSDRATFPEPVPTAMVQFEGEALARGDCQQFDATKGQSYEKTELTCDRAVVSTTN